MLKFNSDNLNFVLSESDFVTVFGQQSTHESNDSHKNFGSDLTIDRIKIFKPTQNMPQK